MKEPEPWQTAEYQYGLSNTMRYPERFIQATRNIESGEPVDPWLGHGPGGVDANLYRTVRELCERVIALEQKTDRRQEGPAEPQT